MLAGQVELDPGGLAGGQRRVAGRWLALGVGGSEARRRGRPVAEGELVRHRERGEDGRGHDREGRRDDDPADESALPLGSTRRGGFGRSRTRRTGSYRGGRGPRDTPLRSTGGGSARRAGRAASSRRRSTARGGARNRAPARASPRTPAIRRRPAASAARRARWRQGGPLRSRRRCRPGHPDDNRGGRRRRSAPSTPSGRSRSAAAPGSGLARRRVYPGDVTRTDERTAASTKRHGTDGSSSRYKSRSNIRQQVATHLGNRPRRQDTGRHGAPWQVRRDEVFGARDDRLAPPPRGRSSWRPPRSRLGRSSNPRPPRPVRRPRRACQPERRIGRSSSRAWRLRKRRT